MRTVLICLAIAVAALAIAPTAFAHGDEPHPKCKKGYILDDNHRCVKAK